MPEILEPPQAEETIRTFRVGAVVKVEDVYPLRRLSIERLEDRNGAKSDLGETL